MFRSIFRSPTPLFPRPVCGKFADNATHATYVTHADTSKCACVRDSAENRSRNRSRNCNCMVSSLTAVALTLLVFLPALLPKNRVSAEPVLSLGVEILKSRLEIKKCGVKDQELSFTQADFDEVLPHVEHIRFLSLPDRSLGRLTVGGREPRVGQTITRRSLEELCFVPLTDTIGSTSFTVCDPSHDATPYAVCTIYITETENHAPTVSEQRFETYTNIACRGVLTANDSENDSYTVTLVSGAEHGTVRLSDSATGAFLYSPCKDFAGRDTFRFRVTDRYGNRSKIEQAIVHVYEKVDDTVFADMTDHWAHAAALELFDAGLLCGRLCEDGSRIFEPEKPITRGDFLAIAMIAVGGEPSALSNVTTDFADDRAIPTSIKGYAAAAYQSGIVRGCVDERGEHIFCADGEVKRGTAAVILARMLVPEMEINRAVTAGKSPEQAAYEALLARGIFRGTETRESQLEQSLTKAQTAQLFRNLRGKRNEEM